MNDNKNIIMFGDLSNNMQECGVLKSKWLSLDSPEAMQVVFL